MCLVMAGLLFSGAAAAPPLQEGTPPAAETAAPTFPAVPPVWISPTPDETGAIVVIVQPGESMWIIAARAGLTLPDLLALNDMTESDIINPGDALIVGYATPEIVTPEDTTLTATLPPPTPRPTEPRPEAAVCLAAFNDLDQDGVHDQEEPLRAGVAFTIYNTEAVVANYITDGISEPKCLLGLTPGEYRITRSISPGEVLTTEGDWSLNLADGAELRQSFGSFMGEGQPPVPTPGNQAPTTAAPFSTTSAPLSASTPSSPPNRGALAPRLAGVIALFLGGLLLLGAVLILLIRQSRTRPGSVSPHTPDERRFRNIDDLE
jgi:LysM repeat protein